MRIANTEFNYFCDVYAQYLPANLKEEMNKKDGAAEQLDYLCKECKKTGQKVYLFIDEYDHFTNTILQSQIASTAIRQKPMARVIYASSLIPSSRQPIPPGASFRNGRQSCYHG